MSEFKNIKQAVNRQLETMSKQELFRVDVDKDLLWDTYLNSFPEGTNPIYRERTEHDCQCCKHFIRDAGAIVTIVDNKLVSVWDFEIDGYYGIVASALSEVVKSKAVKDVFLHRESNLGTDHNHEQREDGSIKRWDHFHYKLENKHVSRDIASKLGEYRSTKEVFKRGLDEISLESAETVLELIEQGSLYRGEEHKRTVKAFIDQKKAYAEIEDDLKDNYCWQKSKELGPAARIRNTVIGTLIVDISDGVELDKAVKSFEQKVAPTNYKRPTALITKKMIDNAQTTIEELGLSESLPRRYAVTEDITINNVLFADRSTKKTMNVFDEMASEVPDKVSSLKKVEEVSVDTFFESILPKADSLEVMFENRHQNNLFSLIAPVNEDSKPILKWDNNFSWAYNGEVADSIKDRVKNAGGRVDGVFRFSHSWNELEPNQSLMDLHVFIPGHGEHKDGNHDQYGNDRRVGWNRRNDHSTKGSQDVDYTAPAPSGYVPVENITFPDLGKMPEGKYVCKIHNWSFRNTGGMGQAEIECGGVIHKYTYPRTKHKEWITVAEVTLKDGEFTVEDKLKSENVSRKEWGIQTEKFQKVNMVMLSPNHWDDQGVGNKHYFFVLDKCRNDDKARGFFNEFLRGDLEPHRKVFEILGSKMKVEPSDNQLSGLGFSSTQRNSVYIKVSGSFNRTVKVNF